MKDLNILDLGFGFLSNNSVNSRLETSGTPKLCQHNTNYVCLKMPNLVMGLHNFKPDQGVIMFCVWLYKFQTSFKQVPKQFPNMSHIVPNKLQKRSEQVPNKLPKQVKNIVPFKGPLKGLI